MVFDNPRLADEELETLQLIDELRDDMRDRVSQPRRWFGNLRRMTLARAVQGSNSIEGYNASLDDVVAAVDGEPTLGASEETQLALAGYRDAMKYVLHVAQDGGAVVDEGLVKALHFMMLKYDLAKTPGRWRPGYIGVRDGASGKIVYEGPDADSVPSLIDEMLEQLRDDEGPVLTRAAMAHLNLVMIHPFRDGNGRMARCLQTLVLAREQIAAPIFSSIEEYLGRNAQAYYDVLAEVGQGQWQPSRDARPWIRFCLTAHYRQVKTQLRRVEEIERLWLDCASLAERHSVPERAASGLVEAALGLRLRNATYRAVVKATDGDEISELTASRDLRALVEAGLIDPVGEKRGRYYVGRQQLLELRERIRAPRPARSDFDPFVLVQQNRQLALRGWRA